MKAAQQSGDVGTILRLIANTSQQTPKDIINKALGSLLYLYYTFVARFQVRPKDMQDMVDGLLYTETSNELERRAFEEWKSKQTQGK